MSFQSLGLSDVLLKAVSAQGYDTPSPIQAQAIPAVLEGRDVMAAAQTGTGKTAGFTLPILERLQKGPRPRANQVRALVLTPTRELAAQVAESVSLYGKYQDMRSAVVFGGVKINPQMMQLRKGVDVLVATPGRLLDLYENNALKFDDLEILVLDEADRMLDMGFIRDIKKIISFLPKQRQNLLFSATFSPEIRDLAKGLVNDPVEISVAPRNSTAGTIEQSVIPVDKTRKSDALIKLIISAAAIHGNKSQGARTRALANFKTNDVQVLVATDIAARGIDIDQLPHVVNFELPNVAEDYVHRIGRTGRAGALGEAVSLVCAEEFKDLHGIERLIQKVLPRKVLPGFEPKVKVPESPTDLKPIKAKKPKKARPPRTEHKDGNRSDTGSSRNKSKSGAQSARPQGASRNTGSGDNQPARSRRPRRRSESSS